MDCGAIGLRGGRELQHLPCADERGARPESHGHLVRQRVPAVVPRWRQDRDHLDIGALDVDSRAVRWILESRRDKTMPVWSPDGKRIAFLENRDGNVQLKTVNRNGKGSVVASQPIGSAHRPLWSPDGRTLYY